MKEEIFENEDDFAPSAKCDDKTSQADVQPTDEPDSDKALQADVQPSDDIPEKTEISEYVAEKPADKKDIDDTPEKKRIRVFPWVLCAFALWIVLSFCFSDGFFATRYRENFKANISMIDSKLGISKSFLKLSDKNGGDVLKKKEENKAKGTTYDNESYLVPYEYAGEASYGTLSGQVCAAKSNHIDIFSTDGSKDWESATSVVNPIMSIEGKYIALGEKGGTKINLFADKKLVFSADTQNEILNINVSSNGDVVVVTKKELYKGAVEVYNKSGEKVYGWVSGKDTIVCADISPSGRRLAVGTIDTAESVKGGIQFFNIRNEESYKTIEIPGAVVCKLDFSGETLSVLCDNRFIGLSTSGKVLWDEAYEKGQILAVSSDFSGNKILLVENNNVPVIKIYSKGGSLKRNITAEDVPDYVDIYSNTILYNDARMIVFGKSSKQKKYPASMDIKKLIAISNDAFAVVYSNSIEFFKS